MEFGILITKANWASENEKECLVLWSPLLYIVLFGEKMGLDRVGKQENIAVRNKDHLEL